MILVDNIGSEESNDINNLQYSLISEYTKSRKSDCCALNFRSIVPLNNFCNLLDQ